LQIREVDIEMVVGRTLWDFLWEVAQNPRLMPSLLAGLILFEVALIIIALLIHSGLITMKFSLGSFEFDVHPLIKLSAILVIGYIARFIA
jgi:hypothetical protein